MSGVNNVLTAMRAGKVAQEHIELVAAIAEDREHLHEGLHLLADLLLFATRNRFGKPEWFTTEGRAACEAIRALAVSHRCSPSVTQLEQAGKVARAIAMACGGEQ